MNIPQSLLAQQINSYSDAGNERKRLFHLDGLKFLRALAKEIGVNGTCDIRSNHGGIAVSGEVTLHADSLYVQLFESMQPGVRILYRSCQGRKDDCGGQNRFVTMTELKSNPHDFADFIELCSDIAKDGVTA